MAHPWMTFFLVVIALVVAHDINVVIRNTVGSRMSAALAAAKAELERTGQELIEARNERDVLRPMAESWESHEAAHERKATLAASQKKLDSINAVLSSDSYQLHRTDVELERLGLPQSWNAACEHATDYVKQAFGKEWHDDSIVKQYMAVRNAFNAGAAWESAR